MRGMPCQQSIRRAIVPVRHESLRPPVPRLRAGDSESDRRQGQCDVDPKATSNASIWNKVAMEILLHLPLTDIFQSPS